MTLTVVMDGTCTQQMAAKAGAGEKPRAAATLDEDKSEEKEKKAADGDAATASAAPNSSAAVGLRRAKAAPSSSALPDARHLSMSECHKPRATLPSSQHYQAFAVSSHSKQTSGTYIFAIVQMKHLQL